MANEIKRYKSSNHVTINNSIMKERDVTLKAKGLYALIMSLPDDWDFSIKGICAITKENYTAVNAAIKELIDAGYCRRERIKEKGKFVGCNYEFSEVKIGSPHSGFLNVENPHVENLNNNNINSTINSPLNNNISSINTPDKKEKNNNKLLSKKAEETSFLEPVVNTKEIEFNGWIQKNYPLISKMDQPLTYKQFCKLREDYYQDKVIEVLNSMENTKGLQKKYVSAYLTANNWCKNSNKKSA